MRSLNAAWRAAQRQCAPSPQALRHTTASGSAAGGPHRSFMPHAQVALELLKQAPAPLQMGTKFWELVCDEHGIGGDGE